MYDEEYAYTDVGDNIIHAYVRLLQIQPQQSHGGSYSEQMKDRTFGLAPI